MKELSFEKMENVKGGWQNTVGCAAGIAMVVASAGTNIFAFVVGVSAIDEYCGGVVDEWK